jgi:hypothetical protein
MPISTAPYDERHAPYSCRGCGLGMDLERELCGDCHMAAEGEADEDPADLAARLGLGPVPR